jgi:spore maturation protein SpmA
MAIALIVAVFMGTAPAVTKGAIDSAKTAVEIALGLVGIMTLWLGIMKVSEAAGLISLLGRMLRPFSRLLFPEIPAGASRHRGDDHEHRREHARSFERGGALGIKAIMALNTAGIQLIPCGDHRRARRLRCEEGATS